MPRLKKIMNEEIKKYKGEIYAFTDGKIIYQKGIDEKKKYGIICCSAVKIPRQLYYAQSATGGRLGVRQCQM